MQKAYFVQLKESNTTINLEFVETVQWNWIPDDLIGTHYTSTIRFSNSNTLSISENDAKNLWQAIQQYNLYLRVAYQATSQFSSNNGQKQI